MGGCATTIERLRPSAIYLLDNDREVTVYRTSHESIYVTDNDTTIMEK